ncbi:MAG: hypothetical protein Q4A79_01810 [Candidatus Saccharibacteria bacterium]|nr:hypothetical protein [Candidatus Saccharibacteria bacterium]
MKKLMKNFKKITLPLAFLSVFLIQPSVSAIDIDVPLADFGYGDYVVTVVGNGINGVYDEDSVLFHYYPLALDVKEDEDTGKYYADLTYAEDDDVISDVDISKIVINVYGPNGNLIEGLSPIVVVPPETKVELKMAEYKLPSGTYRVAATAYDTLGEELYRDYVKEFTYTSVLVPNTGSFFRALDISEKDFLVTGLTVFLLVAASGLLIVTKKDKKYSKRRRTRK